MFKKFNGCWAVFEYLDDLCDSIKELKKAGFNDLSTLSPCPRHEIEHALDQKQSLVPFFTLFFGGLGVVTAYTMTSWMSINWPLPVSSKPLISWIPYTIIGFELMVLFGIYGTIIGIVSLIAFCTARTAFPKSASFKSYPRFTDDRFGLVIRADEKNLEAVKKILTKYQAEEINVE